MSIKVVIGIVIALALVGGGAWYFTKDKGAEVAPAPEEQALTSGTFADIMARSGAWECETTATHEGGSSSGIVVMNDGKLRGEFVAILDGRTVSSSFIHRDGFIYTWSDLLPQGFKVKADAAAGTAGGQGVDPSTEVDYSCAPWTPDESQFEVPSETTFIDVNAMGGAGIQVPN